VTNTNSVYIQFEVQTVTLSIETVSFTFALHLLAKACFAISMQVATIVF